MRELQADLEAEQQRSCAAGSILAYEFHMADSFLSYEFHTTGSFLSICTFHIVFQIFRLLHL